MKHRSNVEKVKHRRNSSTVEHPMVAGILCCNYKDNKDNKDNKAGKDNDVDEVNKEDKEDEDDEDNILDNKDVKERRRATTTIQQSPTLALTITTTRRTRITKTTRPMQTKKDYAIVCVTTRCVGNEYRRCRN
jgi:hypothetical protein